MFEGAFLGRVPLRMGQSQSAPTPSSSDPRFAIPASEQNFVPVGFGPILVPVVAGWDYPPAYPPERYDCVVSEDGLTWICTPRAGAPVSIATGPLYPVIPMGRFF